DRDPLETQPEAFANELPVGGVDFLSAPGSAPGAPGLPPGPITPDGLPAAPFGPQIRSKSGPLTMPAGNSPAGQPATAAESLPPAP
ncbi:MAG: hypothetical protein ACKOJF_18495, partial [Planctomycetaceae bacterium]